MALHFTVSFAFIFLSFDSLSLVFTYLFIFNQFLNLLRILAEFLPACLPAGHQHFNTYLSSENSILKLALSHSLSPPLSVFLYFSLSPSFFLSLPLSLPISLSTSHTHTHSHLHTLFHNHTHNQH